ncbi:tyrosinase family oxidase copper chaperone [Streptomyces sp. CAU 1734]|uniref:tyrosinase family oxidase copper chaperone n=1 Tax=Streptomyces sp. CAU 1734 TaxID=3140360 RepID=UPI003260CAA6
MRILSRPLNRRIALRGLFTLGVVAGAAGALAPLLSRLAAAPDAPDAPAPGPAAAPGAGPRRERFAEMYRGRHIQGSATVLIPLGGARAGAGVPRVEVRIDGRPLPVMRRADGSYLSTVHHYESFATLREVARAAVDELGSAQLAREPLHGHGGVDPV